MRVSQVYTAAPSEERCAVEMETFALLDRLGIPYTWVAHDMANTIEDCAAVDAALGISICKNLFLCNRQKTEFNIALGLCVGHDSLFYKYSDALVTTLIAKDRVLAHNPAGALYCAGGYYKNKLDAQP